MAMHETVAFWPIMARGLLGRCPGCGKGKLFRQYLKQVEHCGQCGEKLGHIRADDGPAWLTIIIVTHVLAPIFLYILPNTQRPDWEIMAIILLPILGLTLTILPRAKGVFIGLIWRSGCVGSEK